MALEARLRSAWAGLAAGERALARALSSRMDLPRCIAEGHALGAKLGISPYATGVFSHPPLLLAAHGAPPLARFGILNVLVAALVHGLFRALARREGKGSRAETRRMHAAGVGIALLAGHRLGLREWSLLAALAGSLQGSALATAAGTAAALYASPATAALLAWPLHRLLALSSPAEKHRRPRAQMRHWATVAALLFALVAGSTCYLILGLRVKAFEGLPFAQVTLHWMERAYLAEFRLTTASSELAEGSQVDMLAPSASLVWYFNAQMFPETRRMFALLTQMQPLLLAVPFILELARLPAGAGGGGNKGSGSQAVREEECGTRLGLQLVVGLLLTGNLFGSHYNLGQFAMEAIAFLLLLCVHFDTASSSAAAGEPPRLGASPLAARGQGRGEEGGREGEGGRVEESSARFGANLFLLATSASAITVLLVVTHTQWIYYATGNSNFYWAMGLCLALARFSAALLAIRGYRVAAARHWTATCPSAPHLKGE